MKLVDILARELKAWPADCGSVTQSQLHTEIHNTPSGDISESHKFLPSIFLNERHEEDGYPIVTRAEWQAAVDALNAPKVVEWDGVGLPPVGLKCEWLECNQTGWQAVEVAGYYKDAAWIVRGEKEPITVFNPSGFRSIRTAEQIAAEERDKARTEVLNAMTDNGKTANEPEELWKFRLKVVGEMLDMGYRKQVAK